MEKCQLHSEKWLSQFTCASFCCKAISKCKFHEANGICNTKCPNFYFCRSCQYFISEFEQNEIKADGKALEKEQKRANAARFAELARQFDNSTGNKK